MSTLSCAPCSFNSDACRLVPLTVANPRSLGFEFRFCCVGDIARSPVGRIGAEGVIRLNGDKTKRWVTPEPVIGPRFARTRWANPPLG